MDLGGKPAWLNDISILRNFIYQTIKSHIEISDDDLKTILSEDGMEKYWKRAFTHETVNAKDNYETLEFYGDSVIAYAFYMYIRDRFPGQINQRNGTLLSSKYASKTFQAKISKDLGLSAHIYYDRGSLNSNEDIREDTLEAFFGALNNSCDDLIGKGFGYLYCYNLLASIYNRYQIDLTQLKQDPKTLLKQLIDALYKGTSAEYERLSESSTPGSTVVRLKLPYTGEIFIGRGAKKIQAEFDAATQALQYYESQNINRDTIESYKKRTMESMTGIQREDALLEKAIAVFAKKYKEEQNLEEVPKIGYRFDPLAGNPMRIGTTPGAHMTMSLTLLYPNIRGQQASEHAVAVGHGQNKVSASNDAIQKFAAMMGVKSV